MGCLEQPSIKAFYKMLTKLPIYYLLPTIYTYTPCAIIASATRLNPKIFAPETRSISKQ